MIKLNKARVSNVSLDKSIVPMINVVFLLLLFFLVAGNIGEAKHADIHLPLSMSENAFEQQPLSFILTQKGVLKYGSSIINIGELPKIISVNLVKPSQAVHLIADAKVNANLLIQVIDELKNNNIKRVSIMTMQAQANY